MPSSFRCLNGNTIKIIALISMTADHIGYLMFPQLIILRMIGRFAFPLFAFMIAEGCYYTHSRKKYALLVGAVALFCQIVYFISDNSLYMCVLVDFLIAILIIFCLQNAFHKGRFSKEAAVSEEPVHYVWLLPAALLAAAVAFVQYIFPGLCPGSTLCFDYGFFGVMLPVAVFIPRLFPAAKKKNIIPIQCIFMLAMLILITAEVRFVQWFSVFSVIILLLYNDQKGKFKLKYLFYIYYPLHLGILYLLSELF